MNQELKGGPSLRGSVLSLRRGVRAALHHREQRRIFAEACRRCERNDLLATIPAPERS
jgi:hypothetical protein